jgi:hypothetical protein
VALDFLFAFLLTNLVEMPVACAILRRKENVKRILAVVLLGNAITLPVVWFVFPALVAGYLPALILAEIFAFALEAAAYALAFKNTPKAMAVGAAIAANFASLLMGIIL